MYIQEYVTKYVACRCLSLTECYARGYFGLLTSCFILVCASSHLSHISLVSTVVCFCLFSFCVSPVLLCLFPVCSLCSWGFLVSPQFLNHYFSPPAFCRPPVCLVFVSRDTGSRSSADEAADRWVSQTGEEPRNTGGEHNTGSTGEQEVDGD